MPTWELYARGRVQGVGYRWYVQRVATELGIYGYVRNLADGSVMILAEADEHIIESFQIALKDGCRHARVDNLEIIKLDSAKKYHDFEIK